MLGNTWLCYILDLLYFGQTSPERETTVPLYSRVINLEIAMPPAKPGYINSPQSTELTLNYMSVR